MISIYRNMMLTNTRSVVFIFTLVFLPDRGKCQYKPILCQGFYKQFYAKICPDKTPQPQPKTTTSSTVASTQEAEATFTNESTIDIFNVTRFSTPNENYTRETIDTLPTTSQGAISNVPTQVVTSNVATQVVTSNEPVTSNKPTKVVTRNVPTVSVTTPLNGLNTAKSIVMNQAASSGLQHSTIKGIIITVAVIATAFCVFLVVVVIFLRKRNRVLQAALIERGNYEVSFQTDPPVDRYARLTPDRTSGLVDPDYDNVRNLS